MSMNNPNVSIIMACYNCERTLDKAVESILNQTYTDWVMICCDDGSTDCTYEKLKEYESKYPGKFIVIKNEKNKKLPYSLNHCLEYVETELVARMDADDWCDPTRLEKQVGFLKNHPECDLVGTGICVSDGDKRVGSIIRPQNPKAEDMLKAHCFSHATIMTYKRVYDELKGYSLDPRVLRVEDADLWCRFFANGFRGYNLSEELYTILENDDSVKRRTLGSRINGAITLYRGYRLMGLRGLRCYKPFLKIMLFFLPKSIYKKIHIKNLNRS